MVGIKCLKYLECLKCFELGKYYFSLFASAEAAQRRLWQGLLAIGRDPIPGGQQNGYSPEGRYFIQHMLSFK
jgi:hypothetical protein